MYSDKLGCPIPSRHFTEYDEGLIFLDMNMLIKMRSDVDVHTEFKEELTYMIDNDDDDDEYEKT